MMMNNQQPDLNAVKEGVVMLIDKPLNWTSFDALNKIRRYINTKIGHCGTLDPLATGLLICCTGKMTKNITDYQRLPKEYTGIIRLGATTASYDLETDPDNFKNYQHVNQSGLDDAIAKFKGEILQIPPAHSAIKKDGERAYKLARKGKQVKLDPRLITIYEFEAILKLPEIHFRIQCSTGTYIRSIAHDLGQALQCGAYLQELRRTQIGNYNVAQAKTVEEWVEYLEDKRQINELNVN